jgi:hypothetical protein
MKKILILLGLILTTMGIYAQKPEKIRMEGFFINIPQRTFNNSGYEYIFKKGVSKSFDKLSDEELKLDNIGFVWDTGRKINILLNKQRGNEKWMQHFTELKALKKQYRHCRIPFNNKGYKTL